jgi:hypothetical protein
MKKLLIFFTIVIFTSCAGTKKTVTETKQKVETLTEITEKKLDTTIFIPGEKVSIKIPFQEFKIDSFKTTKPKVFTKINGRARITVKIDSTGIKATSNCDSIAKQLDFYQKEFKQLRLKVTDTKTKVTEKKGYSLFDLILFITAFSIVSFVAGYLLKTFKII